MKSIGRYYFLIYFCYLWYCFKKDVYLIYVLFCLYYFYIIVGFFLLLRRYIYILLK